MKAQVCKHVKACRTCTIHNRQAIKYSKLHFEAEPAPMKFISMDLIGEFHPPFRKGNRYALTVICMHTGYTFCIPIPNKTALEVVRASYRVLTDNGTEFKNQLMDEVCRTLGVEHKIYSPPYRPQSNG